MAEDWRRELTFADRLTATSKISETYKSCHPSCEPVEASKYAKAAEERARKAAASQAEYQSLIAQAVHELSSNGSDQTSAQNAMSVLAVDVPTSGAVMGRYVNAQHYKDGMFSEVFKAALPSDEGRPDQSGVVALKVTSPDVEGPPHESRREARLLQAAKHDRIIPLMETFQQAGGHFILVFPFLPHDLSALLHQKLLPATSRCGILRDIFAGLAHLHSLDILHRDIKPSNILLASPTGPAYLCDFGIAWSPSESTSTEPADAKILDVGTTCYRPPELLFGNQKYGTKLDMWAAGCVAAQVVCLNGQTLFEAGDLGSELALIKSIFETLGTPDLKSWPEAADFPDWGKMNFKQYPGEPWTQILPHAESDGLDLVSKLVVFESNKRLSAAEALEHPYLK